MTALIVILLASMGSSSDDSQTELSSAAVRDFADVFFDKELANYPIPGVAFILVDEDQVVYSKGYGYADLAEQRPFDPAETVVRAGSVSKCFTAAAVFDLALKGRIEMHAPIDQYITSVNVHQPYGPIRVENLLTHTAGFDDTIIDMHERDVEDWLPLEEYLRAELPAPAMAPDLGTSYSSWDFALAGLLIEDVMDRPYHEVIRDTILQPLGMKNTTFRLPDPSPELLSRLASGYGHSGSGYKQYPFDYIKASPGIAMLTTAEDMGHFIIAQLNQGKYNDSQALPAELIRAMQTIQFINHEKLRGFSYGFAEWTENGEHFFFHDGNAIGHSTRVVVMPQHDVGFFVAFNTVPFGPGGVPSEAGRLSRRLTSAFLDRFFPADERNPIPAIPMPNGDTDLGRFEGHYRATNYSRHTFQKSVSLMEQVPVAANSDGTLRIGSTRYVQVEPNLFQHEDGWDTYAAFREDAGAITHLYIGSATMEKTSAYDATPTQLKLFGSFLVIFFALLLSVAVRFAMRFTRFPRTVGWPEAFAATTGLLNILFLIGLAALMFTVDTMELFAGAPFLLQVVLSLPIVSSLSAALVLVNLVRREGSAGRSLAWKIWLGTTSVIGLIFVAFLHSWNLVGY